MDFATEVIESVPANKYPHPIFDVIKLFSRRIQTQYLLNVIESDIRLPNLLPGEFLFETFEKITEDDKSMNDLLIPTQWDSILQLKSDVILPWPWERKRLKNTIIKIRKNGHFGNWRQDDNHRIDLWLPIGIAWVFSGNHSIATGIIQGTGEVKPEYVHDMSELYRYIKTDGEYYRRTKDEKIIAKVGNVEFAAIFEIGRLLLSLCIKFK